MVGGRTVTYAFDAAGFREQRVSSDGSTSTTTSYHADGLMETNAAGALTLFDVDGPAGDLARYSAPPTTGQTAVSFGPLPGPAAGSGWAARPTRRRG
jgi:YD repeat-containing protein